MGLVGREHLNFPYANAGARNNITLSPEVTFCFRKFHPLISDLVRGAWGRLIREQNLEVLGETADLTEFLFGSDRILAVGRPVLLDILTPAATHVDHFIARARYPVDSGHNFVLADSRCSGQKRDRLS
jgi:hypothetical protein